MSYARSAVRRPLGWLTPALFTPALFASALLAPAVRTPAVTAAALTGATCPPGPGLNAAAEAQPATTQTTARIPTGLAVYAQDGLKVPALQLLPPNTEISGTRRIKASAGKSWSFARIGVNNNRASLLIRGFAAGGQSSYSTANTSINGKYASRGKPRVSFRFQTPHPCMGELRVQIRSTSTNPSYGSLFSRSKVTCGSQVVTATNSMSKPVRRRIPVTVGPKGLEVEVAIDGIAQTYLEDCEYWHSVSLTFVPNNPITGPVVRPTPAAAPASKLAAGGDAIRPRRPADRIRR